MTLSRFLELAGSSSGSNCEGVDPPACLKFDIFCTFTGEVRRSSLDPQGLVQVQNRFFTYAFRVWGLGGGEGRGIYAANQ